MASDQGDPGRAEPVRPDSDRAALFGLLRPHATAVVTLVLLQFVAAVAGLAPFIAVVEIGRVVLGLGPVPADRVWLLTATGAVGLLLRVLLGAASSGIAHIVDGHLQLSLRRLLAQRLGAAPIGWYAQRTAGEVNQVVLNDVNQLHALLAHTPGELTTAVVVPVVSAGYLFSVDWRLTLIALVSVGLGLVLRRLLMSERRRKDEQAVDAAMGRIGGAAVEFVEGIAVVKTFGGAGWAQRRFRAAVDDFSEFFLSWVVGAAGLASLAKLALSPPFVLLVVLAGGAALIASGTFAPADLLPFLLLSLALTAPVAVLAHGLDDVNAALRSARRIRDLLAVRPMPRVANPRTPQGHRLELRDLSFAYEPDRPVLRGVNLILEPGTTTALVGPSGSGKSTLAQLLLRFFDPTSGSVTLGGVDLREIDQQVLYRLVSFVFQDVRLLRTSVADNIALAVPGADLVDVVAVAKAAHIHERITALPKGYDSIVGEDVRFSGGEAQRLSVARALLVDASVLVLDEATAFADPRTEVQVQRAFAALPADRTRLVIAHRLETIRHADAIAVLAGGEIVEYGNYEDLMAAGGQFAELWRAARPAGAGSTLGGDRR